LLRIDDLLISGDDGRSALHAHSALRRVQAALSELPAEQRAVFIAHELEGRSFKELAAESA